MLGELQYHLKINQRGRQMNKLSFIKSAVIGLLLSSAAVYATPPTSVESDALKVGDFIYISGQGGGDASNPDNTGAAIEESIQHIETIAKKMGSDLNHVIKLNVYTNDLDRDFSLLNAVVGKYFKAPFPTRSTVGAAMIPKNHTVEIDAILYVGNNQE